ncbi:MAG: hypothetical protein K6E87_04935 [bacterium]|nr:hypothetical protein [bacterium]
MRLQKQITMYDDNRIILIDYNTVYLYDLNTNKKKKVCNININRIISYDEANGIVRIWSQKNYYISADGTLVAKE